MTISPPPELLGVQQPPILSLPPALTSAGQEAVELAASAGLDLDPWQAFVLDGSLRERQDGKWAAFETALIVSRQNGKGSIIEARELAGLFLFGDELILHSAHEFKTAAEGFLRLTTLIQNTPELDSRVAKYTHSHGDEGIRLKSGGRIRFVARTGGAGRGFSGDLVILDEAYNLSENQMAALLPTLSARPNPQLWYTSSAPDKDIAACDQLARVRRRALAGGDPSLAYFEWSIDPHTEFCPAGCTDHDEMVDPASWAKANPALGYRLTTDYIAKEMAALDSRSFMRERLSVGNYPIEGNGWDVISEEAWEDLADAESEPGQVLAFALDVTPDRSMGSIAIAGIREDGLRHIEIADYRPGTSWMVPRIEELVKKWRPVAVAIDVKGPAGALIADLETAGVPLLKAQASDMAQACGAFYSAVVPQGDDASTVRHWDQGELNRAVAAAKKRKLGEAWAWTRADITNDISPLVAVTLAMWALAKKGNRRRARARAAWA